MFLAYFCYPSITTIFDNIGWDNVVFTCIWLYYTIYWYIFPTLPPPTRFNVGASQPDIRFLSIQHWTGGTGGAIPFKLYGNYSSCPIVSGKDCSCHSRRLAQQVSLVCGRRLKSGLDGIVMTIDFCYNFAIDGNFKCKFYTFLVRPNLLRKMQL